jgi:ferredoxin-type protein NapG
VCSSDLASNNPRSTVGTITEVHDYLRVLFARIGVQHCTGCGMCERACVTKKASIFVLPRRIAMGESSDRYIMGWETGDEKRLEETPEDTRSMTPRSGKSPTDYLNREDL